MFPWRKRECYFPFVKRKMIVTVVMGFRLSSSRDVCDFVLWDPAGKVVLPRRLRLNDRCAEVALTTVKVTWNTVNRSVLKLVNCLLHGTTLSWLFENSKLVADHRVTVQV